ncbi:hypothetical protein [Streptomyces avicenniae]|uniref:hypothetical protein n=1 Tax=Streptomyces avicenniae TaxID=500153 RepID=UPI00069B1D9B|nr:hypothetical protein [Streptomyces avicenniae]
MPPAAPAPSDPAAAAAAARRARRLAGYALLVLVLTVAAAVLSFARGNWFGLIWIPLAGLASNMGWYYLRRAKAPGPV